MSANIIVVVIIYAISQKKSRLDQLWSNCSMKGLRKPKEQLSSGHQPSKFLEKLLTREGLPYMLS